MRHNIRRFCSLPIADQWLLVKLAIAIRLVTVGLHSFGFKGVYQLLDRISAQVVSPVVSHADEVDRHKRLLFLAYRHIVDGQCLARALVLWCLLKRQGVETTLRFGVRKQKGQFEAHAWVEYQGQPLTSDPYVQQRFSPFTESLLPQGLSTKGRRRM